MQIISVPPTSTIATVKLDDLKRVVLERERKVVKLTRDDRR